MMGTERDEPELFFITSKYKKLQTVQRRCVRKAERIRYGIKSNGL